MPLLSNDLAQKLWESLSTSGGKPVSAQITAYATGIIAALKAGTLSNLPGTVNGTTAIGGAPMTLGMAMGGTLSLQADAMIAITTVGMDPAAIPNIKNENKAIIAYIGLSALVNFSVGGIVGNSTATPLSPGPLTAGAGSGGTISGLAGAAAMAAVMAALGSTGPDMRPFYSALCNYITASAIATYPVGGVTGTCPPGGGALTLGAGSGGTIA